MATPTPSAMLFARNGANRPLHQDRQVLRAGDLALEQATQDAMLARARRHLHGWGVVDGFVPAIGQAGQLSIGPGYGVTPLGDELFLPESVTLPDAAEIAAQACGPGKLGCEIIDLAARDRATSDANATTIEAWLIARPASRDAAPRTGVPEGCAHPASTLLPSRRCGGVEFAILCTLPPSHQPKPLDCAALSPFICGVATNATPPVLTHVPAPTATISHPPLPWEPTLAPDANFLVIARLALAGGTLSASPQGRRTLWPVALIQDWIAACLCPLLNRQPTPTPPAPDPTPNPTPHSPVIVLDLADLAPLTRAPDPTGARVVLDREAVLALRRQLADPAPGPAGAAGITEGAFLTTSPARLATALNLPEAKIIEMKEALNTKLNLGLAFR
jgi:hypothetical protein